jgi:hypothetical protein
MMGGCEADPSGVEEATKNNDEVNVECRWRRRFWVVGRWLMEMLLGCERGVGMSDVMYYGR